MQKSGFRGFRGEPLICIMFYLVRIPWIIKKLYPECIWDIKDAGKNIYLTFDDGPHPIVTRYVLDQLRQYNARATFFCIGKNVAEHFDVYKQIIEEGHSVGNHTYDHLNGWKTSTEKYLKNITKAKKIIDSDLFRPPYGRITKFQLKNITGAHYKLKPVMWSVLSGDFDKMISSEECYLAVVRNAGAGSIVVFHDSDKAYGRLHDALPRVLKYFSDEGYSFKSIFFK